MIYQNLEGKVYFGRDIYVLRNWLSCSWKRREAEEFALFLFFTSTTNGHTTFLFSVQFKYNKTNCSILRISSFSKMINEN